VCVNQLAGADVVIVDDMIDTAGTLSELSVQLVHAGVNRIYLCASHGLFTSKSMDIIDNVESLTKVIVTNSLPLPSERVSHKVHQVSIAPMLADLIRAEHFRCLAAMDTEDLYQADQ
jgi:ribose-phosphate pyrophosphokinase